MTVRTPKYRLHKGSGQALVEINGQRIYLGKFGTEESKQRYRRLVADWLRGRPTPTPTSSRNGANAAISINAVLLAYWRFAKTYYVQDGQPTSELAGMRAALRPVKKLYGGAAAEDFGPLCLKAVQQHLVAKGLSRTGINKRINRIRRAFKWAVSEELIPASVHEALRTVTPLKKGRTAAPETEPVKPVSDKGVDAVLPHVSPQVAAMIQLQRLTAMRPGEVVIMRVCDIDRTGPVWIYRPERHKTAYRGHTREIYLGPKAQEVLRPFMENTPYLFSPKDAEKRRSAERRRQRRTPMTPSQAKRSPKSKPRRAKRDRYDVHSYRRAIEYATRKTGSTMWTPHQLRHSRATDIRARFGLDVAQVILGHTHADVTQVYAEVDRQRAVDVAARVG